MNQPPKGERTLQRYADDLLDEKYRQPLKTVQTACEAVGWTFQDKPECCGKPVRVDAFLGCAYQAECETCGKMIRDLTGPIFGSGSVSMVDADKFDPGALDVQERWVAITEKQPA